MEEKDGWSLNNEQAGPGTWVLCSLDKQISGSFQRCSGDRVGSGVISQRSQRLNNNSRHFSIQNNHFAGGKQIEISFHSLLILKTRLLCPSWLFLWAILPFLCHHIRSWIFSTAAKSHSSNYTQLYIQISLVWLFRWAARRWSLPARPRFPSLIAAVGNRHKLQSCLPTWS